MTAPADLYGRQGGRVGQHRTAAELLTDIARARHTAGDQWPTLTPPSPTCCDHCHTDHPRLAQINRCWCCPTCAPDCWAGLRRMAEARRAAGRPLNHWDRRALGTLAHAKEVA